MNRILISLAILGGAAAQQITAFPKLNIPAKVAPINTNDPEYELCTVANSYVEFCVNSLGGTRALATADSSELVECVCCADGTPVSEIYSTCSSYLSVEEPRLSTEIDAYSTFYTICGQTSCGRGSSRPTRTTPAESSASAKETKGDDEETTLTTSINAASGTISIPTSITSAASLDMPKECNSMLGMYSSCSRKIDGFSDQPYGQQASCYCCQTSGSNLVWTDDLDQYAQTCRDWAEDGDPKTFFPLASTFATFCDKFSDVCGTATAPPNSDPSNTSGEDDDNDDGSSGANGSGSGQTVTVTVGNTQETDQPAAGSVVRAGCGAVLVAIVGAALLL